MSREYKAADWDAGMLARLTEAPASPAERIMRLMLTVCTSLAAGCLLAVVVKIAVEALV